MRTSLSLNLGQNLTLTPQLQQAIRLLQLSALELNHEIQQALDSKVDVRQALGELNADNGKEARAVAGPVQLDHEVADLSSANGRYKLIAEALSRKYALAELAIKGSSR